MKKRSKWERFTAVDAGLVELKAEEKVAQMAKLRQGCCRPQRGDGKWDVIGVEVKLRSSVKLRSVVEDVFGF